MIEAGANEVPEDTMIEAIYKAHDVNQEIIRFIDKIVAECGKEKHLYASISSGGTIFRMHLQIMKNGWLFLAKPYISIRRRLFVR